MALTPKSLGCSLFIMGECTPGDDTHLVYAVHMYIYHSHKIEPTLIIEDNRVQFHSPVKSLKLSDSLAWQSHGVSGSLTRGTHVLSPTASRQFPVILAVTAHSTLRFLRWMLFEWSLLLTECVNLDMHLYYSAF